MQKRRATTSKETGLDKRFMQRTAIPGYRGRRIVAPKGAGSSPVGHPLGGEYLRTGTKIPKYVHWRKPCALLTRSVMQNTGDQIYLGYLGESAALACFLFSYR